MYNVRMFNCLLISATSHVSPSLASFALLFLLLLLFFNVAKGHNKYVSIIWH